MPTIHFDNVAPLIANQEADGRTVRFVFACPVSGFQVQSSHTVEGQADAKTQMLGKAKRAALFSMRGPISSAIRSAFGYNSAIGRMLGDVGGQAAYVAATPSSQGSNVTLSKKQKQDAAVSAFSSVASQFVWDATRDGWVSCAAAQELSSPFQRQLSEQPITSGYDRQVAARMLVEVARADGSLAQEERDYLAEFVDPSVGTPEELATRPPLTSAELSETTAAGSRETMLTLAWVLAFADASFDPSEAARIDAFARGLALEGAAAEAAKRRAQGFLVDQALATSGDDPAAARERARDIAGQIGMSADDADSAEAQFHKRRGLART
ncbi:MAG: TerB family tellurite resistance protein [bacterium]|nr:TerB family tellurite resistance protein [bacterium]